MGSLMHFVNILPYFFIYTCLSLTFAVDFRDMFSSTKLCVESHQQFFSTGAVQNAYQPIFIKMIKHLTVASFQCRTSDAFMSCIIETLHLDQRSSTFFSIALSSLQKDIIKTTETPLYHLIVTIKVLKNSIGFDLPKTRIVESCKLPCCIFCKKIRKTIPRRTNKFY